MQGISPWMLGSLWCVVLLLRLSDAGSMNKRDYYEVLAVPQSATDKQVKKAFHSLAMKYHPDKNKSPDAEKIFRDIAEAYEVLSNDEKRRRYNQLGHEAFLKDNGEEWEEPEAEGGRGFFYFSFDELFQDLHVVEDLYLEEPEDSWIFHLGGEHEDDPHEDQGFPGSDMFDLLGNPFISMGQGYSEFEDRDEEQGGGHFCWKLQQSDGSTVEMCEGDRY